MADADHAAELTRAADSWCERLRELINRSGGILMAVRKFSIGDASFERSPGQQADVLAGNVIDQRHGGPITIGFGRYGPNQILQETLAVHDVMVILEGQISVSSSAGTVTAGPSEIVYLPKGEAVSIRSLEQGAITVYVTYPHWQEAEAEKQKGG